jgi:hypothetical protein
MWATNRLSEPSTWAGIAAVAQGLRLLVPPTWFSLLDAATMLAGSVAAVKADPGNPGRK